MIRRGEPGDLREVAEIQAASPEAPRWNVADYLRHQFLVAVSEGRVTGFIVFRALAEDEREILTFAVSPACRRQGVARELWKGLLAEVPGGLGAFQGDVYLEVRESNHAARRLYESLGFKELHRRPGYYEIPPEPAESAIVMKFHSC